MKIVDKRNNSISKVVIWQVASGVFALSVGLVSTAIFSRLLTPGDYGQITSFSSWASIIGVIVGLQIGGTIGIAKKKYEDYNAYCSSVLFLAFCVFLLIQVCFIVFKDFIGTLAGFPEWIVPIIVTYSFMSYVVVFFSTKLEFEFCVERKVLIESFVTLITLLLSLFLVIYLKDNKYIGRILGMVTPVLLVGLALMATVFFKGKQFYNREYWGYGLKLAIPLIFHSMAGIVLTQSDIIMLKKIVNVEETGIYGIVYSLTVAISTLWVALNRSWVPFYYEYKKNNDIDQIKKRSKGYMFLFTSITIGFLLCAPDVFKLLTPSSYWSGIKIIPLIAAAYFIDFLYSFPVNYEFYNENTRMISIATVLSAIVNIILNLLLIPKYKSMGAAIATVISYFICFLFHDFCARFIIKKFEYSWSFYLVGIASVSLVSVGYYFLLPYTIIRWGCAFLLGCVIIFRMIRNRTVF